MRSPPRPNLAIYSFSFNGLGLLEFTTTKHYTKPGTPANAAWILGLPRTNPIKSTMSHVAGMPKHVVVYQVPDSCFWWTRCWVNNRYHIKSTKTENKRVAIEFAKGHFLACLKSGQGDSRSNPVTFASLALSLLEKEAVTAKPSLYTNDKGKVSGVLIPFFKDQRADGINHQDLVRFLDHLNQKNLGQATKKHYLSLLNKIFRHGVEIGTLKQTPLLPKIKGRTQTRLKRDYLEWGTEYQALTNAAQELIQEGAVYKGTPITLEHKLLINFMVNSFIRPSDLRVLKHKHVVRRRDVDTDGTPISWLTLEHPATKTNAQPVQTMPNAVDNYEALIAFRKQDYKERQRASRNPKNATTIRDYLDPDDYVFMPQYDNRNTAIEKIGKIFAVIVAKSGLEEARGKNLTLYSLRHTAIMYRLRFGEVDSLALAKNARTSQQVIEQFYGQHLTTEHARERLHSFRVRHLK